MGSRWTFVTDRALVSEIATPYFESLSRADLFARSSRSAAEYSAKYLAAVVTELTPYQADVIGKAVEKATGLLRRYQYIREIPWKIAVLGLDIEDGFPHTHADVICLTLRTLEYTVFKLTATLIHEMVHVFQRVHPVNTHILLLKRLGLKIQTPIQIQNPNLNLIRANPDKGRLSYGRGGTCVQMYKSDRPADLSDSSVVCNGEARQKQKQEQKQEHEQEHEHPYEAMAYIITAIVTSSSEVGIYQDWMRSYL